MKQIILLIGGLFLFAAISAQPRVVFKGKSLQNAAYSIYIIDADHGDVIYKTPQISLVPASVMKIVTTAAGLEILGADFKFHTQLGYNGKVNIETGLLEGNLVLRGGCDPAFYSEYFPDDYKGTFETWAAELLKAGVKNIQGNLIVDLSQMNGLTVPGGWLWEDIGNYYGAGVSSLTYSDNFYRIHMSSANEPGIPVTVGHIEPNIDSLCLSNNVVASSVNRDMATVYSAPGSFSQLIAGTIPKGRPDFILKAAMPDPPRIAVAEFLKVLKLNDITISGKIQYLNTSSEVPFTLIADKASPSLRDLIVPLNKESINLFAEHLSREIGRAKKGSASLDSSLVAVKEFWRDKNIFVDGFYPKDGSGLSRSNGICPQTLAEILRYMYQSSYREDFFNSLPVAGKDGTLQFAFKGSKLENNLQAKTGSMTRVKSMAGIFTNKDGRKIIFALITNNFEGSQATVTHEIEDFLNEIYLL